MDTFKQSRRAVHGLAIGEQDSPPVFSPAANLVPVSALARAQNLKVHAADSASNAVGRKLRIIPADPEPPFARSRAPRKPPLVGRVNLAAELVKRHVAADARPPIRPQPKAEDPGHLAYRRGHLSLDDFAWRASLPSPRRQAKLAGMMDSKSPPFARDMDLVRAILFWAEDGGRPAKRPDADKLALCYHVKIMVDDALIDGQGDYHRVPGTDRIEPGLAVVRSITWKGQDFLDAMKSDTTWKAVKEAFAKHGVPFVTPILVAALKAYCHLGSIPGLQ